MSFWRIKEWVDYEPKDLNKNEVTRYLYEPVLFAKKNSQSKAWRHVGKDAFLAFNIPQLQPTQPQEMNYLSYVSKLIIFDHICETITSVLRSNFRSNFTNIFFN